MSATPLSDHERVYYRDRLRAARYAAHADAEGFGEVCFAIEALGLRFHGAEGSLGIYKPHMKKLSLVAPSLTELPCQFPMFFTRFDALYDTVRRARNDAMHSGVYARHATSAAIELCIGLEEAVMNPDAPLTKVSDFMVKTPIFVEPWQPLAQARQLMLTHSFSFLPVFLGKWRLVSEIALAQFLRASPNRPKALALSIQDALSHGLHLIPAKTLRAGDEISKVLGQKPTSRSPTLWLVIDDEARLSGVLAPFELM